ncbi:MAG: hypothetical protein WCL37_08555 [Chrysiogenales bacterium]
MKKMIIVFAVILMLGFSPLAACIIEITPTNNQVKIGDQMPVTVILKYEHRRCVIELKDTQVKGSGLEIIEKSDWQTISSGVYSLKMTVLIKNAKAALAVIRECDKKGISEEILKFKVI